MSINGFDDEPPPLRLRPRISLRFVAGSIILGTALGLAITVILLIVGSRGQPPRMTAEAFQAAKRRWSEFGPRSYDIDIQQSLGINGEIHIEVRSQRVTKMTVNNTPAPPRSWDNWSVPGLFEIIGMDLDRNKSATNSPEIVVFQQAEFDPKSGLPRVYRRTDLASNQSVEWRITAFRPQK